MKKVSICVCTKNRNVMLRRLLFSLVHQQDVSDVHLQIIIADNDERGGACEVHKEFELVKSNIRFSYGVEKVPGIPFARNKAVSMVDDDTDFVIFVDDDEYMTHTWLYSILSAQAKYDADVVLGPSYPEFITPPPRWIYDGRFFLYPVYNNTTGCNIDGDVIATNNLLVRKSVLSRIDGPFDISFGMTGSDDSKLGKNLEQITSNMIYTHEAVAYEIVPLARMNFKWIMQRSYRSANTLWLLEEHKTLGNLIKYGVLSIARIVVGSIAIIPALVLGFIIGWHHVALSVRLIVRGIGVLIGMSGRYYEEYKHYYTSEKK